MWNFLPEHVVNAPSVDSFKNRLDKQWSNANEVILTTNLAAVVWLCVSVQNLTNFCPHALILNPNVPKFLFA